MTGTSTVDPEGSGSGGVGGSIDRSHLLLVGGGARSGLGGRSPFAVGGYRVTLVARCSDGLRLVPAHDRSDLGRERYLCFVDGSVRTYVCSRRDARSGWSSRASGP
jgi:hypothetical protein